MKKKFIVFTLCFTLIFSSLNYKKTYADVGVISLPILATVSALAVGTGIIINNNDDLYDIGRIFYDYIDKHNTLTWQTVQSLFSSSVALQPNKLVSVESEFLDIVKDFFDNTFSDVPSDTSLGYVGSLPLNDNFAIPFNNLVIDKEYNIGKFSYNDTFYDFVMYLRNDGTCIVKALVPDGSPSITSVSYFCGLNNLQSRNPSLYIRSYDNGLYKMCIRHSSNTVVGDYYLGSSDVYELPYLGGYTWDNVENKKENESVSLPVPGDLGNLVGQTSDEFWGNRSDLVGSGDISIPLVGNPSITLGGTVSFPNSDVDNPSIPGQGIWDTIKDFIIGLVVPSDTFWTDTWGGLYNNFTNSFPMVDMDNFNNLVTNEKKFPNIDINIMGVVGRVVNGDVVNSIVDWLRPIIAGFMMLCLMLFNYRKIYKLIRNSEPFGGIASGTSDFSTGISEYSKQEVVKATDMVAEYRAWKERGGK